MFISVPTATVYGARGHRVSVDVSVHGGLPGFDLLGLPDTSCREARDRVRAALLSIGVKFPGKHVTVNLAPSMLKKSGAGIDLALAVGLMVAFEHIDPTAIDGYAFVGEVGLDGSVRRVPGVAAMVGVRPDCNWVVPGQAIGEATAASQGDVRPVNTLAELRDALTMAEPWPSAEPTVVELLEPTAPDLADVKGQPAARLALEIAAAGGHHLMFVGPPGSGKTMLAERLPGLLPDLNPDDALESSVVHSAAGLALPRSGLLRRPPFRSPHHTSSEGAIVGGGSHRFRPGEASLAHGGVLFLDEMGQFSRKVLDTLREALESGHVMIGRVNGDRVPMPARFQLIGATNPCPCGGGAPGECSCDERMRQRYLGRLSGPFLDRFDLRVGVQRPDVSDLLDGEPGESSATVAERVRRVRDVAMARGGVVNAQIPDHRLDEFARLDTEAMELVRCELEANRLSGRGLHRIRRVARTVADLAGSESVELAADHVSVALALRSNVRLDRETVMA